MLKNRRTGFTLTEVMVSLVAASIVTAGAYATFDYQHKSYQRQEQVADMQQNLRAGLYFMLREIRMAGYDPTLQAEATILKANRAELTFEADGNVDGDIDDDTREIIRFALTKDADRDGIADSETCNLGREYIRRRDGMETSAGLHSLARNLSALEFCYLLDNGTAMTTVSDAEKRARIRGVIVSVLFRTARQIQEQPQSARTYVPGSQDQTLTPDFSGTRSSVWGPFSDRYQRRLAITRVRCRNMGLNPYED